MVTTMVITATIILALTVVATLTCYVHSVGAVGLAIFVLLHNDELLLVEESYD